MKNLTSFALSSLLGLLVGCGDNIDGSQNQPATPDPVPAPQFPASCLEAGNGVAPQNGQRTLYFHGDQTKPWLAYCHNGDEFLSVGDWGNYGSINGGGLAYGADIMTEYKKLRIDPETLMVDITNTTFAQTTGGPIDIGTQHHIEKMHLGVSMSCNGTLQYATGGINVVGTPFKIRDEFLLGGVSAVGGATLHNNDQVLETYSQGDCGYTAPPGMTAVPVNLTDGWLVQLDYVGLQAP